MKKYGMIMGLMMVSSIIFAQQKEEGLGSKHAERIKKELSMSDEQFDRVKSINKDFNGKIYAVRKDSSLTKDARLEKIKSIHNEKEAALRKELNDEQYNKYKAFR